MKLKTVRDLDVHNKRVLVRVDYNVPISSGIVGDPLRIEGSFKTIKYLLDQGCSIVLCSHLGRPDGRVVPELSLAPVAKKASEMLNRQINFVPECVGAEVDAAARDLKPGEIILLENLRFHPEEETNDAEFAKKLAGLGEVYVDDAFAAVHRAHASTVGVTEYLESAAGLLVDEEVRQITRALEKPNKPLVAVVGGAKVSTKMDVLNNLLKYVDRLVIGGAMANTFLASQGKKIGKSKFEPDFTDEAQQIIKAADAENVELILPEDLLVAKSIEHGPAHMAAIDDVADDDFIVDLGPKTVAKIMHPFDFHGTIIWNGPLGITEVPEFAHNSRLLADNIIESGCDCIIGGGDTAAFVDEAGLHDKFTWVSTGGGASLELMAGNELPGLKVLEK
jgi:phosphoglycerate kinase